MVKLAATLDLGSSGEIRAGSSPVICIKYWSVAKWSRHRTLTPVLGSSNLLTPAIRRCCYFLAESASIPDAFHVRIALKLNEVVLLILLTQMTVWKDRPEDYPDRSS